MDDASSILDYASPRKRSGLRLPARSKLTVLSQPEAVVLREVLEGQLAAIYAEIFAFLTGATIVYQTMNNGFGPMPSQMIVVPLGCVGVELLVMLLVVHHTWRQTLLIARNNELSLRFSSPFYRKRYRWSDEQIAGIHVKETANPASLHALGELVIIRRTGGEVHLFTDHRMSELTNLPAALTQMLHTHMGQPLQAEEVPMAVIPLAVIPTAPSSVSYQPKRSETFDPWLRSAEPVQVDPIKVIELPLQVIPIPDEAGEE